MPQGRTDSAVVLAGGRSSRMGFDKQRLQLNGTWLMDLIVQRLRPMFERIVVVTNEPSLYADSDVVAVRDEIPGMGPLGGIHAGLKHAQGEYAYLLACDMPNIDPAFVEYLFELAARHRPDACVARYGDWYEPFHALYARRIVPRLEAFLNDGQRRIVPFLYEINCLYLEEDTVRRFTPDWSLFANINTREDLARYDRQSIEDTVFDDERDESSAHGGGPDERSPDRRRPG